MWFKGHFSEIRQAVKDFPLQCESHFLPDLLKNDIHGIKSIHFFFKLHKRIFEFENLNYDFALRSDIVSGRTYVLIICTVGKLAQRVVNNRINDYSPCRTPRSRYEFYNRDPSNCVYPPRHGDTYRFYWYYSGVVIPRKPYTPRVSNQICSMLRVEVEKYRFLENLLLHETKFFFSSNIKSNL